MSQKILIIEPDIDSTLFIRKSIRNRYECNYLPSTESACRHILTACPDVIILAENVLGSTALDFIELIKEKNLSCPIVLLTEKDSNNAKYIKAGVHSIVIKKKPFSREFSDALLRVLDGIETKQALDISQKDLSETIKQLNKTLDRVVASMARISSIRDFYTVGHHENTAIIAQMLAKFAYFSEQDIKGIYYAGLLHDIGKINVPLEILCVPRILLPEEIAIVQRHPVIGYEILSPIELPWNVASAVLQHHERCDGSGYPNSLTEKDICREARLLAIADVLEAMTACRPYRSPHSFEQAIDELSEKNAKKYDQSYVSILLKNQTTFKDIISNKQRGNK